MNQEQSKAGGVAKDFTDQGPWHLVHTSESCATLFDSKGRELARFPELLAAVNNANRERGLAVIAGELATGALLEAERERDTLRAETTRLVERVAKLEAALKSTLPAIRWAVTDTMDDPEPYGFQAVLHAAHAALKGGA